MTASEPVKNVSFKTLVEFTRKASNRFTTFLLFQTTGDVVYNVLYEHMSTRDGILSVVVDRTTHYVPYTLSLPATGLSRRAVILSHGGGGPQNPGGDKDMSCLEQVSCAFAEAGIPCLRYTFKGIAKDGMHIDRELRYKVLLAIMTNAFRNVPELQGIIQWILAGLSVGGVISMLASLQKQVCGLVCISFPDFHIPLDAVTVPTIFISGKQDPMCAGVDIASRLRLMKAPAMLTVIPRARHRMEIRHRNGKVDVGATRRATAIVKQAITHFLKAHEMVVR